MIDAPYIRRFFALVFDILISLSLLMSIALFVPKSVIPFPVEDFFLLESEAMIRIFLYYLIFYFFYEFLFSVLLSSSPGKVLVNVDIVFSRGHTFMNIFLRSLVKSITVVLGPITMLCSFVVAIMRKEYRSIHDLAGRTRVCEETRVPRLLSLLFVVSSIALFFMFYDRYLRYLVFDFSTIELPSLY